MKNPKAKGSEFERKISKLLSFYLTDNITDSAIWRTDTSGARATINSKKGKNFLIENVGDIKRVEEKNKYPKLDLFFDTFMVELKFYKSIDYRPPLKGKLKDFFNQVIEGKNITGKKIFLLIKENRKEEIVFSDIVFINIPILMTYYFNNIVFHCYSFSSILEKDFFKIIPNFKLKNVNNYCINNYREKINQI